MHAKIVRVKAASVQVVLVKHPFGHRKRWSSVPTWVSLIEPNRDDDSRANVRASPFASRSIELHANSEIVFGHFGAG